MRISKKIAMIGVCALTAVAAMAFATACGSNEDKITYELNEDGQSYTLVKYEIKDGKEKTVTVASEYKGKPVTMISGGAFWDNDELTGVIIPDSVTEISNAFDGCENLTSISIPNSVTSMSGVHNCPSLEYNVSDGVQYLGNGENPYVAAMGAVDKTIKSVSLNEGCKVVASSAFSSCPLTKIELNEGLVSIGSAAFNYQFNDTEEKLKTIKLPKSIRLIGSSAFNSDEITAVSYAGSIESWCEDVELYCYLGGDVMFFGEDEGVTVNGLFSEIALPEGVTRIPNYAFAGWQSLTKVSIPDSVTEIGDNAFKDCTLLQSVSFGANLTGIGDYAFYDTAITAVELSDKVTTIGTMAFSHCTNLTSVRIPESIERIGSFAFSDTKITEITLPEKSLSLGTQAFASTPFMESCQPDADGFLFIGKHLIDAGKASGDFTLSDDTLSVAGGAFAGSDITSLTLHAGIKYLPDSACANCESLTSVTLPEVVELGAEAFLNCYSLKNVSMPKVVEIGGYAFSDCYALTKIELNEGVTVIREGAFKNCASMKEIVLPSTVKTIEEEAFRTINLEEIGVGLQKVTLPKGIEYIGEKAFGPGLENVYYKGSKKDWKNVVNCDVHVGGDGGATIHYK